MPDLSHPPLPFSDAHAGTVSAGASAYWLAADDDLALGCECADPALQIERWAQECAQPLSSS
jgi:hypothetical protein